MPAVSVIIPVYNTEETLLRRCIESVLNQEYRDLEVIAVDDGSKNNAGTVLDSYVEKDERMHVIHKPNGGVSAARNTALAQAQGTYVQFMDADDWIPDVSTKELVRAALEYNADLVVGDFYRVVGGNLSRKSSIETSGLMDLKAYAAQMMETPADYYFGVLWNKLYRRDLIEAYNIRMDESLRWCEDFIFNLEYLLHTERIFPLSVPVYYYVKTEGSLVATSLTLSRTVQMKMNVFKYYNEFYKNVLNEEQYRKDRLLIAGFLVSAATDDPALPMMPGTKKVGEEAINARFHSMNENLMTGAYYVGKLYDKYLNIVALKYDLDLKDVRTAAAMQEAEQFSMKMLADYTGMNQMMLVTSLEKLMRKGFISLSLENGISAVFTECADGLLADIDQARTDLYDTFFSGLSEEESVQWTAMSMKIMSNLRNALVKDE